MGLLLVCCMQPATYGQLRLSVPKTNCFGETYSADDYYQEMYKNSPFSTSDKHLATPFPPSLAIGIMADAEEAESMHDADYGKPKRIGGNPNPDDRLPLGDAVAPMLLMLVGYALWRRRKLQNP